MTSVILLILSFVLAFAGAAKLRAGDAFSASLRKLLPKYLVRAVAIVVPLIELTLAAWLITGYAIQIAALSAMILLVFFTFVLLKMWRIGLQGCGCFGEQAEGGGFITATVRNLLLIAGACFVAATPSDGHPLFDNGILPFTARATVVLGIICLWTTSTAIASRWNWIIPRSTAT